MLTLRTILPLSALLMIPVAVGCDTKPEKETGEVQDSEDGETDEGATTDEAATTDEQGETIASEEEGTTAAAEVECGPDTVDQSRPCDSGVQFCALNDGEGKYFWGVCVAEPACTPGAENGCEVCELDFEGKPVWFDQCPDDDGGSTTPLVLNFGTDAVEYGARAAAFDLGPQCGATDWPSAATPWLALDRDGSGAIEDGRELFGSATRLAGGANAEHGFVALAELDLDRDGKISASDPDFAKLLLWADHDADRRSTGWELAPAEAAGLVAIELTYRRDARCDARGNCEIERAAFTWRDAAGRERTGEIVDVHLSCQ